MKIKIEKQIYNVKICKTFKDRFLGLMFQKEVRMVYGFPHCHSVHTFFMKIPIDLVFCDQNGKVLNIVSKAKPWHIFSCPKAYYTFEFPEGTVSKKCSKVLFLKE